jgi:hypothetical protein
MECSPATTVSSPSKKMWSVGKDEAAMTPLSLRFAYAWLCSVLASVSIKLIDCGHCALSDNYTQHQNLKHDSY